MKIYGKLTPICNVLGEKKRLQFYLWIHPKHPQYTHNLMQGYTWCASTCLLLKSVNIFYFTTFYILVASCKKISFLPQCQVGFISCNELQQVGGRLPFNPAGVWSASYVNTAPCCSAGSITRDFIPVYTRMTRDENLWLWTWGPSLCITA